MPRVKRGIIAHKRREKTLSYTKGFKWGRKSKERAAKEALLHAWANAYRGRKQKKRDYRREWQIRIGAALIAHQISYSKFMGGLKKAKIELDRKVLAQIAEENPDVFGKIVEAAAVK